MKIKNELILDGKIQKDVKIFDEIINFNISSITGKYKTVDNKDKNRYTFIRVVYIGEINDEIKNILRPGNYIRLYGKIDSEQYQSQTGKIVYNKILIGEKIKQLKFDEQTREYVEVD